MVLKLEGRLARESEKEERKPVGLRSVVVACAIQDTKDIDEQVEDVEVER